MNKKLLLGISLTAMAGFSALQAEIIHFRPGVVFERHQPIDVIITDSDNHIVERTLVYDPVLGGIDLGDIPGAPGTSLYFPDSDMRYLWYHGHWVAEDGYYWNNGEFVEVDVPGGWDVFWGGYWGGWDDRWHDHWARHRGDERWRYRGHEHWHGHGHEHHHH